MWLFDLNTVLTLPAPIPDKEKKLTLIFIFKLHCGASKNHLRHDKEGENKNLI